MSAAMKHRPRRSLRGLRWCEGQLVNWRKAKRLNRWRRYAGPNGLARLARGEWFEQRRDGTWKAAPWPEPNPREPQGEFRIVKEAGWPV